MTSTPVKSIKVTDDRELTLGLEGPLIFVPIVWFLIVIKFSHNNFPITFLSSITLYLGIRWYMSDKPHKFLDHFLQYPSIPKKMQHVFGRHTTEYYDKESMFYSGR